MTQPDHTCSWEGHIFITTGCRLMLHFGHGRPPLALDRIERATLDTFNKMIFAKKMLRKQMEGGKPASHWIWKISTYEKTLAMHFGGYDLMRQFVGFARRTDTYEHSI